MDYRNYVLIQSKGDPCTYDEVFNEVYTNDWYTVVDKQLLGEVIGREICDNYSYDEIYKDDGEYDNSKILNLIEKELTSILRNEIFYFVVEYLDDNLEV